MSTPCRVRIKICGMTRADDVACAVEAGVDAVGFIFYAKSPRAITPAAAKAITDGLPPFVDAVGVFVDEEVGRIAEIVRACGLGYVQLHGNESPDSCRQLARLAAPCRLLKAFRVGPHTTAAEIAAYRDTVHGYLLDTYQPGVVGGTGRAFDWTLIDRLGFDKPSLLAGGLDLGNIGEALATVRPYGVDANSGLEDGPGRKNHDRIRRFIAAVRAFEVDCLARQQ